MPSQCGHISMFLFFVGCGHQYIYLFFNVFVCVCMGVCASAWAQWWPCVCFFFVVVVVVAVVAYIVAALLSMCLYL